LLDDSRLSVSSGLIIAISGAIFYLYSQPIFRFVEGIFLFLLTLFSGGAFLEPVSSEVVVIDTILTGSINLIGGLLLRSYPARRMLLGFVIVLSSMLSFFSLGGLFIGGLLGLWAGVGALGFKSHPPAP
jgi:hypothetical protein